MTTAADQQETQERLTAAQTQMLDASSTLRLLVLAVNDDVVVGHLVSALASARLAIRRLDQAIDDLKEAAGG